MSDDSDERFSLLELDLDVPAARPAQRPTPAPQPRPAPQPEPSSEVVRTQLDARITERRRTQQPVAPAPSAPPSRPLLKKGELVAGAAAAGHGVLVGFGGRGTMTYAEVVATIGNNGFPLDWAPARKSAHAQAGRAVMALNSVGFVVRADSKKGVRRTDANAERDELAELVARDARLQAGGTYNPQLHRTADEAMQQAGGVPSWAARWQVGTTSRSARAGEAYGRTVLVATLDAAGALWLESTDQQLADRVRADYEARINAEVFSATDISDWLKQTLIHRFRAAKLGGNWYVRREYAAEAERLLSAFAKRWGENWLLPALPIATSDQLRDGLLANFTADAQAVLDEYREQVEKAREAKKTMGSRLAASLHAKLVELAERAVGFAAMLGEQHLAQLRHRLSVAANEVRENMSGMVLRFEQIFDELRREKGGAA